MREKLEGAPGRFAIGVIAVAVILIAFIVGSSLKKHSTEPQQAAGGGVTIIEPDETPLAATPEASEASSEESGSSDQKASVDQSSDSSDNNLVASITGAGTNSGRSSSSGNGNNTTIQTSVTTGNTTGTTTTNVVSTPTNSSGSSDQSGSGSGSDSGSGADSDNSDSSSSSGNSQGGGSSPAPGSQPASGVPMSEAERYYSESGEIVRIIDASTSEDSLTETEAKDLLAERGFVDYPITYDYVMGGEYKNDAEISGGAAKRPMYETDFISENGELWHIFVINGAVMTNPVSYNLQSTRPVMLLLSESKELTSYDSDTNNYFVTIPYDSTIVVKVVDRIDASALNEITSGEIDGL